MLYFRLTRSICWAKSIFSQISFHGFRTKISIEKVSGLKSDPTVIPQ